MAKRIFTAKALQTIEQAVKEAETASGGEIVPVFARQSSFYEMALWRGGFILSCLSGLAILLFYLLTDYLLFLPPYLWLLIILTSGLAGAALVIWVPSVKRMLIGKKRMHTRALDHAKNAFYDYRVTNTEQRSGILLFISFFERQTVILADIGIAEIVSEAHWKKIIDSLTQGLQQGKITESICEAILSCGRILDESGIHHTGTNGNELSDDIRLSE